MFINVTVGDSVFTNTPRGENVQDSRLNLSQVLENKVSLAAVSNEPRCTCCFSPQIRNLCLSTDNIQGKLEMQG